MPLKDLQVGYRILVRGQASPDEKSVAAAGIIVMKQIEDKDQQGGPAVEGHPATGATTAASGGQIIAGTSSPSSRLTAPPSAQAADDEPTLPEALQFVQAKLNALGKISFVAVTQDTVQGTKSSSVVTETASGITTDAASTCTLRFHWTTTRRGQSLSDQDIQLLLKAIANIEVMPLPAALSKINAAGGHPEIVVRTTAPEFWALFVSRNDNPKGFIHFSFDDQKMADRVAKAIQHTAELCGAGETKEPY